MPESQFQLIKSIPQFFLDGLGVGFKLVDANNGRILAANSAICRNLGYSRDELLAGSLTLKDVTHPDDWDNNLAKQQQLLNRQIGQYTVDKRYVRKDGSVFWGHINCAAVVDENGSVRWTTCTIEDVTEQIILREHMTIAKKLGGFATWNWQIKTNSSEISQNYNTLFGLPDDTVSPTIEEFMSRVHPDDRLLISRSLSRALSGGSYSHEYRMVRPDGELRWMRSMAQGVQDANGIVTNLIGVTLDITDEKASSSFDAAPEFARTAVGFMEANWNKPISAADIARKSGVSLRVLFKFFRSRQTSPGQILKKIKLRHARQMLTKPSATTSVSGAALKCGFQNLGHFAKYYRMEFGELPSVTLARHKATEHAEK